MRKRQRRAAGAVIGALVCAVLGGCAGSVSEKAAPAQTEIVFEEIALSDGVYQAEFDTDSSMFHVNEACDGKGTGAGSAGTSGRTASPAGSSGAGRGIGSL